MPVCVRARAPRSPAERTDSITSSLPNASSSARGSSRGGDDVEVLDAVGQPPRRAGQLDAVARSARARSASTIPSPICSALCSSTRGAGRSPTPAAKAASSASSNLRPEAAHVAQPLGLGRVAQRLERVDAQLVVQRRARLGPSPGRRVMSIRPGRELRAQLLDRRDRAGVQQRLDLLLERLADPRQLGHAALARQRREPTRRLAHGLRRVAVGEHAVHDRAVELVEVGELVEQRRRWRRWADRASVRGCSAGRL